MDDSKVGMGRFEIKPRVRFENVDPASKIELLSDGYRAARESSEKTGVKLSGCVLGLNTSNTEKFILNSDGAEIRSLVPRAALSGFLSLSGKGGETIQRFLDRGEASGWEAVERWNLPLLLSEEADALARTLLEAEKTPRGEMDIILGPEVVGLVCHESCGHPSEADRMLGREAAQAGETYLKPETIGKRIGSTLVTIVDDPTIPGSFGFYLYDEEGVKSRKRYLMRKGIVEELLQNRETAASFGVRSNGSLEGCSLRL